MTKMAQTEVIPVTGVLIPSSARAVYKLNVLNVTQLRTGKDIGVG